MDMLGSIKATVGAIVAKPGDVKSDGSLPANKITAKQRAAGVMVGAGPAIVWMFRLMGMKVSEDDVLKVLAAGVTLFGAGQWMVAYFTKDQHVGEA